METRPATSRADRVEGTALVLSGGLFDINNAKTAHGLVRGSERFKVVGVVDSEANAGRDAGERLDGVRREIPMFATLQAALRALPERPRYCVLGVATKGGKLPPHLRAQLLEAIQNGLSIVNGLHEHASDVPELAQAANAHGVDIIDIRRPPADLRFWSGDVFSVRAAVLAVLGTDCALGKRTTSRFLVEACRHRGITAEMLYTGQTGWMQGARWGTILDAIPNDFVSGELERAVVACDREANPSLIVIEGQSSLRNPSGPCGAELLLSAGARSVVLQHAPARRYVLGFEELGLEIPPIESEIELIARYGAKTIAIVLNGEGLEPSALRSERDRLARTTDLPVACPLLDGIDPILPAVLGVMSDRGGTRAPV